MLAHHWLAIVALGVLPIPFLFTGYSPVVAPAMWEFTLAFGCFYLMNRIMLWWVHRHVEGGSQEMWRGSQMWVWISPNHIKAIWKVLVAENWLFKKLFAFEITFAVTSKDKKEPSRADALRSVLGVVWPYLLWIAGFAAGVGYFVVKACMGSYGPWELMTYLISIMWGSLILLSIWPPLATLLPREETEEGWKISWDAILHLGSREQRAAERAALQQGTCPRELIRQKTLGKDGLTATTDNDCDFAIIEEDEEAMDIVPGFDDDDSVLNRTGSNGSILRQGSAGSGLFRQGSGSGMLRRMSIDVMADKSVQRPQQQRQQRRRSMDHHSNVMSFQGFEAGRAASYSQGSGSSPAAWATMPFTGFEEVDQQLQPPVAPRARRSSFDGFAAGLRRRSLDAFNPWHRHPQHTSSLAALTEGGEDSERETGCGTSSEPGSSSGSIDTAVFIQTVPAAAAASPFAAAGVQSRERQQQQHRAGSAAAAGQAAASSGCVFSSSLLYSSGGAAPAAAAAAAAAADTAKGADQDAPTAAAASKFRQPPKKASSFTHGSKNDTPDNDLPPACHRARASVDIGSAAAAAAAPRRFSRMSLDFGGRHRHHHHQQQQQHLLHFSPAAESVRATGTAALGRISLPGRSRAVMEASSLYTHLILPEPAASGPGCRAGGSRRLLAVTADGTLLPGGAVLDSHQQQQQQRQQALITDPRHNRSSMDSNASWNWAGSADSNVQGGVAVVPHIPAAVGSFDITAGRDADAAVLQMPAGDNAADVTSSSIAMDCPAVQGQLQQLACAVINRRVSVDMRRTGSGSGHGGTAASFGGFSFSRPSFMGGLSAGGDGLMFGRQPSASGCLMTSDMSGWTVADCAGATAADNDCTEMFNTQAAVIPTLPENIYEHTIAAVPNFGERAAPKASWMFFIVNTVLLASLFGASFVEVYCS
ncbi:hypothetical protein OEZ86_003538 [Tetradesmus obliquus]|nr:hypothetical protein OEZ86_003538 [Tetradesmus obliquus]